MNKPAAFRATYADWKLIKTRQCIQVVFEIPLEDHDKAYQALGGMPNPANEQWFGIAALDLSNVTSASVTREAAVEPGKLDNSASRPKSTTNRLPNMAQRAGILCNDKMFWRFLEDRQRQDGFPNSTVTNADTAAGILRTICGVGSRSELKPGTPEGEAFQNLTGEFTVWRDAPDLVEREPRYADCQI